MTPETVQLFTNFGILGFVGILYFKNQIDKEKEDKERIAYERERERTREERILKENAVINNNTTAVTNLNVTIKEIFTQNKNIQCSLDDVKDLLLAHSKQGEKNFTENVTNHKVVRALLEAIVRESFEKRVGEGIAKEVVQKEKEALENEPNVIRRFHECDNDEYL